MKSASKYVSLLLLSAILSAATVVLGALPMRLVRRTYGRWAFCFGAVAVAGIFAAFQMTPYAVLVAAQAVLVGLYSEVEDHGGSVFYAGTVGIFASIGTMALSIGLWLQQTKTNLFSVLRAQATPVVDNMMAMNPQTNVSVDSLVQHLPSGVLIALMTALAFALVWERPLAMWLGLPVRERFEKLTAFRVPDAVVWIVVASLAGSFVQHGISWLTIVSTNLLYVLTVLYFFQGLAVASVALRAFGIGPFWRGIWYVLIVVQLFLLVSLIGFADLWLELRERISRKPAETKKGI